MRMLALTAIVPAILMSVAACQPAAETPVASGEVTPESVAPEPAPAPASVVVGGVDLSTQVRVSGTEPFWGVDMTPGTLVFTGVDRAELRVPNPGAVMQGESAVIAAQGLTITLKPATCSDGMSDRVYPIEAEVMLGTELLKGCANSQAALDAEPAP
jgi:uncharacterized membrane protein